MNRVRFDGFVTIDIIGLSVPALLRVNLIIPSAFAVGADAGQNIGPGGGGNDGVGVEVVPRRVGPDAGGMDRRARCIMDAPADGSIKNGQVEIHVFRECSRGDHNPGLLGITRIALVRKIDPVRSFVKPNQLIGSVRLRLGVSIAGSLAIDLNALDGVTGGIEDPSCDYAITRIKRKNEITLGGRTRRQGRRGERLVLVTAQRGLQSVFPRGQCGNVVIPVSVRVSILVIGHVFAGNGDVDVIE